MKKILILTVVMLFAASTAFGVVSGVVGSKHDLSTTQNGTYKGTSDQVCIYCHTPHRARTDVAGAPLWNKDASGYTVSNSYSSATFDGTTTGATVRADVVAPLCMSCHDGTKAAAEHYVGATKKDSSGDGAEKLTGRLFTSTNDMDLAANHPVDFLLGVDAGIDQANIGVGLTYPLMADGTFTCATCHDVHAGGTGSNEMLRGAANLSGSAFCLECHL